MTVIERATHIQAEPGRRAFAVFLALHGIAHLVETSDSFGRAADGKVAEYLGGVWKISDPTTLRVLGVAWAIGAFGFLATAWAFWMGTSWRIPALVAATLYSLALSIAGLSASVIGVVVDVVLLGVAVWMGVHRDETEAATAQPHRANRR